MGDEGRPPWTETALRAIAAGSAEIVLAPLGLPGLASAGAVIIDRLVPKRTQIGQEFVGVIAAYVGQDELLEVIKTDDERNEILWSSTQTAMSTGIEGKRVYLARVVANAMTSTEPIDEAQLIVGVLKELDGPHIRALTTIRDADDANQLGPSLRDEILQNALKAQPYPVLAALARTGVVRQGSEERENGVYSITFADTLGITGISDFGRKLLADLESVTTNEV